MLVSATQESCINRKTYPGSSYGNQSHWSLVILLSWVAGQRSCKHLFPLDMDLGLIEQCSYNINYCPILVWLRHNRPPILANDWILGQSKSNKMIKIWTDPSAQIKTWSLRYALIRSSKRPSPNQNGPSNLLIAIFLTSPRRSLTQTLIWGKFQAS